ncbi:MAG: hypothetical protein ACPGXK_12610, partial [Phycisphaerae bacterium]
CYYFGRAGWKTEVVTSVEDAKTALDNAEAQWPDWAESGFAMNIMRGILWFDRMEDLESLKAQAQALIDVR